MHMLGDPRTMQADPQYGDVVAEVTEFLIDRAEAARAAGVTDVWIDPGIGFGKSVEHNLALLAHLDELAATGFPVLVGTSRKRFLGVLLAEADHLAPGELVPVDNRLEGSLATAVWAMEHGARMVRVHDVAVTARAARAAVG
jgi:dihydropteroate synthase